MIERATPTPRERSAAFVIVVAVGCVLTAMALALLAPTFFGSIPFMPFFAAVFVASWAGGTRCGLLALVCSVPAAMFGAIEPIGSLVVGKLIDVARLASYAFVAAIIVAHGAQLQRSSRDALAARREALDAAARARFLSHASEVLASSLDLETTLRETARLAVPELADWCAIHLLRGEGDDAHLELVAAANVDPAQVDRLMELDRRVPQEMDATLGPPNVLRTKKPEIAAEITDEMLVAANPDPRRLELARALRLRSFVCVPLLVGERAFGTITLVTGASQRNFGDADVRMATELATRAAVAAENARLFAEAKRAVGLRDQFLSVAAHELRTPTTAVMLNVQQTLRKAKRAGAPTESLEAMQRQMRRLVTLIDELLDVSRVSTGRLVLRRERLDLASSAKEICARLADLAHDKGCSITVHVEGDTHADVDPARVEQVLMNLVTNAVKYGAGAPIDVHVTGRESRVDVCVADRGIGIDPKDHTRIFERFERASSVESYGGFGVGLWIVREIVRAHGGTVRVRSELGKGATFVVELPRAA